MSACYRFTQAIARTPGQSIAHGLRAGDTANPDPALFADQHRTYVRALEQAGVDVRMLNPLEDFPDSVFIEDAALCLPEGAVLMHPGTPSRAREPDHVAQALGACFAEVREIGPAGHIEGGDILVTGREILVGLSDRTDRAGARRLQDCVAAWRHKVRIVETPKGILHFKTACGLLDADTVLVPEALQKTDFFKGYRTLVVPEGEEAAANAVRVNDHVLLSAGYPKTAGLLTAAGYRVVILDTGEAAKVDGGLSCMSLRFSPGGS